MSKDKRWIATADSGKESLIVVWDSLKATPVKIISNPGGEGDEGVVAMDMSADAMFLATLSNGAKQTISIWEWTVATSLPAVRQAIGDHEHQHCVCFNPVDVRDLVTNGTRKVIFWNWGQDTLTSFHPPRGGHFL